MTMDFLAMLWILPLMETNSIKNLFEFTFCGVTIQASLVMMSLATIILLFLSRGSSSSRQMPRFMKPYIALLVYFALRNLISTKSYAPFELIVNLTIPVFFASSYYKCIISNHIDISVVIRRGLIVYCIAIIGVAFVNFKVYGFSLDGNTESRIISTGGGPVILGYTIALIFAELLCARNRTTPVFEFMVLTVCVLGALLTGSRGGLWPLILLVIVYFSRDSKNKIQIKRILLIMIPVIIAVSIEYHKIIQLFPRLFSTEDTGRILNTVKCLNVFGKQSILNITFGEGLGCFFPYLDWYYNVGSSSFIGYNEFVHNGIRLLVQPHNTYIYVLLEGGIIGFSFLIAFIGGVVRHARHTRNFSIMVFAGLFLFLFFLESIPFVAPGAMGLWWILLLLAMNSQKYLLNGERRFEK